MSLPIVLALSCWAKSSAKHESYADTIMKMPHTGAQACKSADDNQSRSRQIWHFLRAVPIFYWVVMPCCILNEDEPFICGFHITNVVLLQITCGNTSSTPLVNIYNIIAHPCYCHNCKQLIKECIYCALESFTSNNIFSIFKPIDFMEHLALFHCIIIAYCIII